MLKGSIIGTIGWRLFDLQLVENRKYEKLSDDNQFNYRIIPPERGRILDRKMRLLAGNMDGFSLVLNWNKNLNVHQIIKKISNIIILNEKDIINFFNKIRHQKNNYSKKILITKNLSQKDVSKLAVRSIEFPEISFSMSKRRVYPQGIIAGHITGYTGPYSDKNIQNSSLNEIEVGKRGVEKYFDVQLRGEFGRKRNEVTSKGHVIDSQIYENTKPGLDVQVSLDMKLQAFAVERLERGNYELVSISNKNIKKQISKLKNFTYVNNNYVFINKKKKIVNPQSGSVIVMDVNNGEILCSVSSPGFDPNIFSRDLEVDEWDLSLIHI